MADKYDAFLDSSDTKYDSFLDTAEPSAQTSVKIPEVGPLTTVEKIFSKLPNIPQPIVNVAAGMVPGFLENAPRVKNVATEDNWRTLGRVLKPAETLLGMKAAQAVTAIPKIAAASGLSKNIVAGSAAGATGGSLSENPIEGSLYGGALGGVLGAAFRPLERGADILYDLVSTWKAGERGQVVKWLNQIFPDAKSKQQAIAELNNLSAIVPGEKVTSGLASVSGKQPIPALKSIEERARKSVEQSPTFSAYDIASEEARVNPIESIAFPGRRFFNPETGKVEPSELEALRSKVTDPLYALADKDKVQISKQLENVISSAQTAPLTSKAEGSFEQMMANKGLTPKPSEVQVEPAKKMVPWSGGIPSNEPFVPQNPIRSIQELQRVKDEFSKKINEISQAIDNPTVTLRNQLIDARNILNNAMKSQSGSYAVANQIFKNYSAPQNRADVAEELLKALRSSSGKERASSFLSAMEEAPRTLKRSGLPMFSDIRQVMTPEQVGMLSNVSKSLSRQEAYKGLQAPNLPQMKSPSEEVLDVIPSIISRPIAFIKKALSKAGAQTDSAAQKLLNEAATDPKKMAALLSELTPSERLESINWLRQNRIGLLGGDIGMITSNAFTPKNTGMLYGEQQ